VGAGGPVRKVWRSIIGVGGLGLFAFCKDGSWSVGPPEASTGKGAEGTGRRRKDLGVQEMESRLDSYMRGLGNGVASSVLGVVVQ
jgi:hypothetical protein